MKEGIEMNFCPSCGEKRYNNKKYCGNCGFEFPDNKIDNSSYTSNTKLINELLPSKIEYKVYKRLHKPIKPNAIEDTRYFYLLIRRLAYIQLSKGISQADLKSHIVMGPLPSNVEKETHDIEKAFINHSNQSMLYDKAIEYLNKYFKGDYSCLLNDVNLNSTVNDLVHNREFFYLVHYKMGLDFTVINSELRLGTNNFKEVLAKEKLLNALISVKTTTLMEQGGPSFEKEDSQQEYLFQVLLKMNDMGTLQSLLSEYLIKYYKKEYDIKEYHHKSLINKNSTINTIEAVVDFSSPRSAIKRVLGFLKE